MKKVRQIVIMGVSGSGKTTIGKALSKKLNITFFDGDKFHPEENILKMSNGMKLDDNDRLPWLNSIANFLKRRDFEEKSSIVACSALKNTYRAIIKNKIDVEFVYLKGNKKTIENRLSKRENHFMPSSLLESQFYELEEPNNTISVRINQGISKIVDDIITKLN